MLSSESSMKSPFNEETNTYRATESALHRTWHEEWIGLSRRSCQSIGGSLICEVWIDVSIGFFETAAFDNISSDTIFRRHLGGCR